jgi:hypothetical protein
LARRRKQTIEHVVELAFGRRRLAGFDQYAKPSGVQVKPHLLELRHRSPGCLLQARQGARTAYKGSRRAQIACNMYDECDA